MRILHVSYSRAGGIGNVVSELVHAQTLQGHNVEWDFVTSGPLRSEFLQHPIETVKAGLDDFGLRSRDFQGPISSLRSGHALMKRVAKRMHLFDVVHLHGGTLDLRTISEVETPARIVVSHHDMRLVTGACHQSMGCDGYQANCSDCPALRPQFQHRAQQNRLGSFPLEWRHTAPSPKFAAILGESALLKTKRVAVVPNPVPTELTKFEQKGKNDAFLTIVGSSSSSSLRKLAPDTVGRLARLAEESNLKLVSMGGNLYDPSHVENLGPLNRIDAFDIMSRSSICVTPTKFESFSTAGLEALYLGAYLLAPVDSPQGELAASLGMLIDIDAPFHAIDAARKRKDARRSLIEAFDIQKVKRRFEEVYFD